MHSRTMAGEVEGLGVISVVAACFLAWGVTRQGGRRGVAFVVAGSVAAGWGALFLLGWTLQDGEGPLRDQGTVQLGVLGLYGLAYGLLPAGLLRPFVGRSWAPRLAFVLAGLLPFLGLGLFALLGDANHPVSQGMGHLGDLLFLSPLELGEGVTSSGIIAHRFRIHYVALGAIVLGSLALQFLPVRRQTSSEGTR